MLNNVVAWLWAHPLALALVVLAVEKVLTALAVWATYPNDEREWRRIKRQEPRRAALITFLRGWGVYPTKVLVGVRGLWVGALPKDVRDAVDKSDEKLETEEKRKETAS